MSSKKIVMRKKLDNEWTDLFPKTVADHVVLDSGTTVEDVIYKGGFVLEATGDNNYAVTSADITSYSEGLTIEVFFTATNTGAPTLKINNLALIAMGELDATGNFVALKANTITPYKYLKLRVRAGNLLVVSSPGSGGSSSGGGVYLGETAPEDTNVMWLRDQGEALYGPTLNVITDPNTQLNVVD